MISDVYRNLSITNLHQSYLANQKTVFSIFRISIKGTKNTYFCQVNQITMSASRSAKVTKQKATKIQPRTTVNPVGHPRVCSTKDKLSDNLNPSSVFIQDTSRTISGIDQPNALEFSLPSSSPGDASRTTASKEHPSALNLSLSSMGDSSSVEKEVGQKSCISQQQQCSKKITEPSKGTDDSVIAYVHQLSPSKRNKKDTLYYSTLLLQTSENECQDALLYSKQKHKLLSDSQKSHTPVKIQRFTHTSDGKKLIINDITKIVGTQCSLLKAATRKLEMR